MRKNLEKLLAIVIAVCMLATMLSLPAVSFADTWDGTAVSDSLAGSGTEEDPFIIATAADLAYFANQANTDASYFPGQFISLTADIDLNNLDFPAVKKFSGTLNGNGHEISGININKSANNVGFFRMLTGGSTIENLTLSGSVVSTGNNVGGFAGYLDNGHVIITNCVNNLNVTGNTYVGGFAGNAYLASSLTITGCVNNGSISSSAASGAVYIGGFIGNATYLVSKVTFSYCINNGAVSTTGTSAGGFVGDMRTQGIFEYCENTGAISGEAILAGFVSRNENAATDKPIIFKNCINVGAITGTRATGNAFEAAILGYYGGAQGTPEVENVYYRDSDITLGGATNDHQSYAEPLGEAKTDAEFADGTVLALLNSQKKAYEQGTNYPILILPPAEDVPCEHTDVSDDWSYDDENHWHICNTCGEAVDVAAHTESDWIIDTEATTEATGAKHKECTVCGKVLAEETIPINNPNAWDGSVSDSIEGEGTEEAPYLIGSAADLAYFAAQVNGGKDYEGEYVKVTADINLSNVAVAPIGNTDALFKGTFDGDGFTVSGLNISSDSDKGIGFFGAAHMATIKNINVKGNVICTGRIVAVAGLLGKANNVTLYNCSFDGTVTCGNTLTSNGAGGWAINDMNYLSASGLVCEVNGGTVTIDKCYVAGTIIGFGRGGSLVGSVNGDYTANITNSYSTADITVEDNGYTYNYRAGGGLIGFLNTGTINMDSCYYYGTGLEARSSGMGGAIISHFAGGTFNCTNTYYNSDKNAAEYANYEYGTGATEAEFADGTVLALLNGDAEEPVFEQGEFYPVFAAVQPATYVPGDINGDVEVDNKDLIRLFQYLSEWGVEVNEDALDVNGDQAVDNKDLIRLFQYLSEWNVEIF